MSMETQAQVGSSFSTAAISLVGIALLVLVGAGVYSKARSVDGRRTTSDLGVSRRRLLMKRR